MDNIKDESLLSICIPTYNRAGLLYENVLGHIDIIKKYDIPIYISNNCSPDNTDEIAQSLMKLYNNIYYFKQSENIKDLNFPFILRKSEAGYSWLLGDKNRINSQGLNRIIEIIKNENFDAIVVNDATLRVKDVPTQVYTDCNKLLNELGWHMTSISSLILSKKLIEQMNFERYSSTNFMQMAGIFEAIVDREFKILWLNEPLTLEPNITTVSSWAKECFPVFFDSWASAVLSLPPKYSLTNKLHCIKKHGVNSHLFSFTSFLSHKKNRVFNLKIYFRYFNVFRYFTDVPSYVLFFIAITPKYIISFLFFVKHCLRMVIKK